MWTGRSKAKQLYGFGRLSTVHSIVDGSGEGCTDWGLYTPAH